MLRLRKADLTVDVPGNWYIWGPYFSVGRAKAAAARFARSVLSELQAKITEEKL